MSLQLIIHSFIIKSYIMKFLKLFLIALVGLMVNISVQAQTMQLKATNGKLVTYAKIATKTTADSVTTVMDTLIIADNSAGLIEVTVLGSSTAGDGVTGKQIFRYHKSSGTLTLSSATNVSSIVTDTGISGATFTFSTNSNNNVQLTIKGKPSTTVNWRSQLTHYHL